jgi:hypothetical protein
MTDADLLAKKLAFVESCVADLRRLAVAEDIASDVKERRLAFETSSGTARPASMST